MGGNNFFSVPKVKKTRRVVWGRALSRARLLSLALLRNRHCPFELNHIKFAVPFLAKMNRRIRFGLVFVGPRPATDGEFLRDLGIRHIEGCSLKNRHYVLFTLKRARRSKDILNAVEAQNKLNNRGAQTDLEEELMLASDGLLIDGASTIVLVPVNAESKDDDGGGGGGTSALPAASDQSSAFVAVFDKGHAFQSHEIFRVIYTAKLSSTQVPAPPAINEFGAPIVLPFVGPDGDVSSQPSGYWSWSAAGVPEPVASGSGKRAVSELSTDLVEASVKPSSSKRVCLLPPNKEALALSEMERELFGVTAEVGGGEINALARPENESVALPMVEDTPVPPAAVLSSAEAAAVEEDEAVFEAQVRSCVLVLFYLAVIHTPFVFLTALDGRLGAHRSLPRRRMRNLRLLGRRRASRHRPPPVARRPLVVVHVAAVVVGRRGKQRVGLLRRRLLLQLTR